MTTTTTTIGMM
jgi:hypothetical protein